MVWVPEQAPNDTVTCHMRGFEEQRELVDTRWMSRYAWMRTSVQLLCHGTMLKWLRQGGGVVPVLSSERLMGRSEIHV